MTLEEHVAWPKPSTWESQTGDLLLVEPLHCCLSFNPTLSAKPLQRSAWHCWCKSPTSGNANGRSHDSHAHVANRHTRYGYRFAGGISRPISARSVNTFGNRAI